MGQQSSAVCVAGSAQAARPVRRSLQSVDGGQAQKLIGVIGSRSLPLQYAEHVGAVVEDILRRKNQIASAHSCVQSGCMFRQTSGPCRV